MWITNSHEADIFLVFANVDFDKGYKGITCFVVDRDMGVQVGKKENKVNCFWTFSFYVDRPKSEACSF
jgi:alkylation response protein AidB-like acyl-CoA dehydrogenase